MAAADRLQLQVILQAVDRATAPLKRITGGSQDAGRALKLARERLKELAAQQKAVGEFKEMRIGLSAAEQALGKAQARVKELAQGLGQAGPPTKAMTRELAQARKEAGLASDAFQRKQAQTQRMRDQLTAAGISAGNLGTHERKLRADIKGTTAEIERQTAALKGQAEQQRKLRQLNDRHGKAMKHTGMAAGAGLGTYMAGERGMRGSATMLMPGMEFDTTMSRVQALTRLQKDSPELAMLRAQSRQLGADTMFSATQAAEGQAFLAMAGFTPKNIHAAMPGLLDMSKAADMDLGRGADIASNILSGYGIDPAQMDRVADILTKTFTTSNTDLEMLGLTMKYIGPVARTAGMDLETAAAMAGLLGNVGIQGEKSGTAMRAMLLRLAAPTKAAAAAMKELNVSAADKSGNVRNIVEVLADVAKATEKMGSSDRLAVLKEIFGEEPAAAMSELIAQSGAKGVTKYLDIVKANQGAAAATAKVMADNLTGDWDEIKSAWDDVGIELFDQNNNWLRGWAQGLTDVIRGVSGWIKQNPMLAQALTRVAVAGSVVLAVMGAIMIPLALLVGKMLLVRFLFARAAFALAPLASLLKGALAPALAVAARGLTAFSAVGALLKSGGMVAALQVIRTAVMSLGAALLANPITAIVAGIALAGLLIYQNWAFIKAYFVGFWDGLMQGLAPLRAAMGSMFDKMAPVLQMLKPLWDGFVGVLGTAWHWISQLVAPLQATQAQLRGAGSAGEFFGFMLGSLISMAANLPSVFMGLGRDMVQGIIGGMRSKAAELGQAVKDIAGEAVTYFKDKLGIRSPSRVFALAGAEIPAGAALGIQSGEDRVRKAALALAGSTMLGMPGLAGAGDAGMDALRIDRRPPLSAPGFAGGGMVSAGDTITIHIHPPPGMDPAAIGRAVAAELDRREQAKRSRVLSTFGDID